MKPNKLLTICIGLILTMNLANVCFATAPQLINYQGRLTNASGKPLDTIVAISFAIYNSPAGGTAIWNETESSVMVVGGAFSVLLGSSNSLVDTVFNDSLRFLGVQVGGDPELTPRIRLAAVGYSFRVSTLDGSNGGKISGDILATGKGAFGPGCENLGDYSFVAGENDSALGMHSVISGGFRNLAEGDVSIIGGGEFNHTFQSNSTVSGGSFNLAYGSQSAVGGGKTNIASGNNSYIGGGGTNRAIGNFSVVAGGGGAIPNGDPADSNVASGDFSSISGGSRNIAGSYEQGTHHAAIVGGLSNQAIGSYSFVGGGNSNQANGICATIAGGNINRVSGDYSFAAGNRANAVHSGSFVWADDNSYDFASLANKSFSVRSTGGVRFVSAIDGSGNPTAGVQLASGGGSWSSISDRNLKRNYEGINAQDLLQRLSMIPVSTWNYISQPDSVRHIGPTAQDFYSAFHVGEDDKHITTIDADGVALAAIQELYKISLALNEKTQKIDLLEARIQQLQALVERLLAESK